ncbi:MAG: twin-arginine translocase TatA/TatE family subunit [Bacteroidales bacterium]|nr:twin-arginine translocase TatA/TatE family subunit [Bacteroidales bacterium]
MNLLFIGGPELIIILVVVLVLFGGKKIPELMRGLGKGVKEYKDAVGDVKDEMRKITDDTPTTDAGEEQQDAKQ